MGGFEISAHAVTSIVSAAAAAGSAIGILFAVYRWYLKQNVQDKDIDKIKEENTLIVFALSGCLDGLQQLGANHTVTVAKDKLDKYINKRAHK